MYMHVVFSKQSGISFVQPAHYPSEEWSDIRTGLCKKHFGDHPFEESSLVGNEGCSCPRGLFYCVRSLFWARFGGRGWGGVPQRSGCRRNYLTNYKSTTFEKMVLKGWFCCPMRLYILVGEEKTPASWYLPGTNWTCRIKYHPTSDTL